MQRVPVILAGGKGTRLWPLSRSRAPKQFLSLIGEESLFQKALARVSDRDHYSAPIVITNEDYRFFVAEQARQMGITLETIILEPVARNTAPAIAAVAEVVANRFGGDACLHILASDHEMTSGTAFLECVRTAAAVASDGHMVTFGIVPSEPATGYGYIKAGAALTALDVGAGFHVEAFTEKPDRETAEAMLDAGGYYWNSGMFVFQAAAVLDALQAFEPALLASSRAAVAGAEVDQDFLRLDREAFAACKDISIDYAVMERTDKAAVVPFPHAWSDLGSWQSVWKESARDGRGNAALGAVTLDDCDNVLALSRHTHLALQGVRDAVVVASEDAVYVGNLSQSERVGALAKALAGDPATADLASEHPTVYRPWGGYTSVLAGERFQVKKLFVLPGKKLSLQKHHHRAEHWVVVSGTAEVTNGDDVLLLEENQSTYIPVGQVHRLANPGKMMLEVIEVQTGSYLGEDDIIRIDDEFGRS